MATSGNSQAAAAAPAAVDNVRRYPHDAPERDMVNFPPLKQPVNPGKLRIGVIPDEWFQFMYNKTGVTGKLLIHRRRRRRRPTPYCILCFQF